MNFDSPSLQQARRDREHELRARYPRSFELSQRARRVIPGGNHLSGKALVDSQTTPSYFDCGQGATLRDVDGHTYLDYLMAFGAQLLGYAHPEVEAAAHQQGQRGNLLSLNHPLHVELIETLLPLFPGVDMGVFVKNGSEATTAALRIARQKTGRRCVARAGYHGWHDWCLPLERFVPDGLERQVAEFSANDPASLQALFDANPRDIAAVILAPEMVVPHDPAVFHEVFRIARAHGALLIMDEVKTGLRIAPGSVSARIGLEPDILTISKSLGNGWPIAATLGRREVMEVAAGMHYSGTFHGETSAIAAALATIRIVHRDDVQRRVHDLGQRLLVGLNAAIADSPVSAIAYAEPLPAMPFFKFTEPDAELNAELTRCFYREVLAAGSLLHPRHLWFLSAAHTEADVDCTLRASRAALRKTLELCCGL